MTRRLTGRHVRPGGVAPHAGWAVVGCFTHGRRRVRSVSGARWPIHPSSCCCNRASASTVKSSIPRIPQRALLGFIGSLVGTDRSSFDLFKGGLRLWRGVHGPLWPPCIGRGWCGLVASLVDVVCGRTHMVSPVAGRAMCGPVWRISPVAGGLGSRAPAHQSRYWVAIGPYASRSFRCGRGHAGPVPRRS
jgi:hypothetical protein